MATDLSGSNYSETDASNNNAAPNGMPEGMAPSGVNDAWRQGMGAVKRAYDRDHGGTWCTVGGTANAVTLTYSVGPASYVQGENFAFKATATNTGATTINVSGLGAKNVFAGGAALVGGEIQSGQIRTASYDGTQFQLVSAQPRQPTRTVQTSGSGTYTTPSGATRLNVRMVGGGGGGSGSGGAPGAGGTGGNTTFSTLTASGGTGGLGTASGGGGAASGGDLNIVGGQGGQCAAAATSAGGIGASSPFGGAGAPGAASTGGAASANSGAGGGGAATNGTPSPGGGGAAGGYVEKLITAPSATYSYAVGAAGTAGTAGSSGAPGGAGGSGIIIIDEYYN